MAALGLIAFAIWIRYASRIDFFRDAGWTYLRSAIYIFLFSAWGVSLSVRIVQTHTRRYLLSISTLMVLWLLLRSIKYAAPLETVCRYLWYGYYLPLLFIPMFSLLVALSLGTIGGLPAAALDAGAVCRGKYFVFAGADKRRAPMDLYLSERRDER